MFETIKDFCEFHRCSLVINYKASVNIWSVALLSGEIFTGHHHAEDLATAFNSAKKDYMAIVPTHKEAENEKESEA